MQRSISAVLCSVFMWACGDQEASDPPASLVAAVAEPAGANCAAGGEAIETGVDANGNGALDANEVTATSYVCSAVAGSAGAATLVAVVTEPAGAHCANGGQAIETGVDANGNGALDPSEVSQTSYICAGANGAEPLLRIDVEPAGAHCSAGGSAIHVGIDTNGDNTLEDSEIQSTTYVCRPANPTIIDGSFIVKNSVDAAQLVGVTTITGNLTIDALGLTSINLDSLQTVGGVLTYSAFSGTVLAMPALTAAGSIAIGGASIPVPLDVPVLATVGSLALNGYTPTTATFPALTTITDGFYVNGSNTLTTLSLPVLTSAGAIGVSGCSMLASLDLSHVATTQSVSLYYDTALTSVSLHLTSVGSMSIQDLTALTTLDLSSLATVSQSLDIEYLASLTSIDTSSLTSISGGMYFAHDDALTALAFPVLTSVASTATSGGLVEIDDNGALLSFTAPLWTSFGPTPATPNVQIGFYSNAHLPTCQVLQLFTQLNPLNSFEFSLDDSASCP